MNNILITKKISVLQQEILDDHHLPYEVIPTLSFTYNVDMDALPKQADLDQIWIFTSVKAVHAVKEWIKKINYKGKIITVGELSKRLLEECGKNVDFVGNNSEDIVAYLTNLTTKSALVYFRGNRFRMLIPSFAKTNHWPITTIECYQSLKNSIPQNLSSYSSYWIYSPMGAEALAASQTVNLNIPVFSIGPVTSEACKSLGFVNVLTSSKPTFETLLELYQSNL